MTSNEDSRNRGLTAVLCLLTIFGPISMDLYLPVLPALTDDLGPAPEPPCRSGSSSWSLPC